MEKKDLYLSGERINEAHAQGVYECINLHKHKGSTPRAEGRKAIAKASADYAVKKVIEDIQRVVDEAPYNKKILSVIGYLGELENLMELDK